jgi:Ca2+-binding EF-hand superfamily protein
LKNAIVALGLSKSAEEILTLVEDLDSDGNNEVDFEEFL